MFSFINEMTGWMLVHNGFATGHSPFDIYRTTDQGRTWELVNHVAYGQKSKNGLTDTINPTQISFVDEAHGFITGEANNEREVIFYKTNDSGKTWSQVHLPLPKRKQDELVSVKAPQFFNEKEAILPVVIRGKRDYTVFYKTVNKGNSWQELSKLEGSGEVDFFDTHLGWVNSKQTASQENSSVFSSIDGGKTWEKVSDLPFTLHSFQFTSSLIGWGINEKTQLLMKTTDGGMTWK